jgi:hypothetical protein
MSKSNEFFYLDGNGKLQDEDLQEPILDNKEAHEAGKQRSIQALRSEGWSDERLAVLFVL